MTFTEPTPDPEVAGAPAFPTSYRSCGQDMTLEAMPERIVALDTTMLPALLDMGLGHRIAGVVHPIPDHALPPRMAAAAQSIPVLDPEGHPGTISMAKITEAKADLVVGSDVGLDYAALAEAKIPALTFDAFCTGATAEDGNVGDIKNVHRLLGSVLHMTKRVAEIEGFVDTQLAAFEAAPGGTGQTVAVVKVSPEGSNLAGYGATTMTLVAMAYAEVTNAIEDSTEGMTMADLADLDPDYLLVTADGLSDEDTLKAFMALEGAGDLRAVIEKHVGTMPALWANSKSTLTLDATKRINDLVGSK